MINLGIECLHIMTIKEFVNKTAKILKMKLKWKGKGLRETAVDENNKIIISIDKKYFRPLEVDYLRGNSKKAKKELKWRTNISLDDIIKKMVDFELRILNKL